LRNVFCSYFQTFFESSEYQFGFKKGFSCSHAIYSIKQISDFYTSGGSTINICSLDISKAFDKLNFYCLLSKLVERGLPIELLNILYIWFKFGCIVVKWGQVFSSCFVLLAGVRQGGVLSPFLFGIYVDDLLKRLHNSGFGCVLKGIICNAFMYADDLVLITASVSHLHKLLAICDFELCKIGLSLNVKKSNFIRVGKRFKCSLATVYNYWCQCD